MQKIESAQGIFAEQFAFCQTMPLEEFNQVAEGLRMSGYRPTRFRPYSVGTAVQVAAVWTRDGQDWQLAHGLSAGEMTKRDAECRKQSFQPVDVSGYTNGDKEQYAAVWGKAPTDAPATQLEIGLDEKQWGGKAQALGKEGYRLEMFSQTSAQDGKTHICGTWAKVPGNPTLYSGGEANYSGDNYLGELQVDVQISKAEAVPNKEQRFTQQLAEAEKKLQAKADDPMLACNGLWLVCSWATTKRRWKTSPGSSVRSPRMHRPSRIVPSFTPAWARRKRPGTISPSSRN